MSKIKWICDDCEQEFDSRGALVEHLKDDLCEIEEHVSRLENQLEDMGENPYA